jgi:2-haloacid dehalogenase
MAPAVVAFDVNETLLDLRALDPLFERGLGSAALRGPWFAQMLQLALVGGLTGRYLDFTTAQRAALAMLAEREGLDLEQDDAEAIVGGMRRLPPHDDAAEALERLADGGLRLAALTNSPLDVAEEQLAGAGLRDRFEAVLSADEVGALKPAPAPYRLVAERLGVAIGDVRLVAAHAWDVAGALAAGCAAAFVARPGMVLSPVGERPDVIGADLREVADQILQRRS